MPTCYAAVFLTFDLLSRKLPHLLLLHLGNVHINIIVFLGLFVFELGACTGRTDTRPDGQNP